MLFYESETTTLFALLEREKHSRRHERMAVGCYFHILVRNKKELQARHAIY